jgi:hypothetical protein
LGAIWRRSLESVLAGVVTLRRQLITRRVGELERLPVGASETVLERVESKVTRKGKSGHNVRRGDEGMCSGVSVVTASEITVVGGDDWART